MDTLKIYRKGPITMPVNLRNKYKHEEDQTLPVIDIGEGTILLTPKISQVDRLTNQIAKRLKEENITFSDLMEEMNEVRNTHS